MNLLHSDKNFPLSGTYDLLAYTGITAWIALTTYDRGGAIGGAGGATAPSKGFKKKRKS